MIANLERAQINVQQNKNSTEKITDNGGNNKQ